MTSQVLSLRIIWLAFIASIFAYALVLTFIHGASQTTMDIPALRLVLIVMSVSHVGVSVWWRHRVDVAPPPSASVTTPADESIAKLRVNCIIVWAISEGVAVYGVVLALLAGDIGEFIPFAAGALALLFLHRPTAWTQWPAD